MLQTKSPQYRSTYQLYQREYCRFIDYQSCNWIAASSNLIDRQDWSQKKIQTLQLASIDQLTLNAVNTGKYLKLKVIHLPFKANAISLLVEDHTGQNCIFVSLYNYETNGRHFTQCFPVGTIFYLEDPYFKVSVAGWNIIRVENHYDVILENHPQAKRLTQLYQQTNKQPVNTRQPSLLETLRVKGVELIKKRDYARAYGVYTSALKSCISSEDLIKFKLNKAITCLKLNLNEQYCQLSEEVLKIDSKNIKGLYHQAKAKAILGDLSFGERLLTSPQIDETSRKELKKFMQLEGSFRSGKINWYEAIRNSETGSFKSDGVKIDKSPFGMGIFATRSIKAGQLIFVEKPLLCQTFEIFTNKNEKDIIISLAIELYSSSPEFRRKFNQLSKGKQKRNRSQDRNINRDLFSSIIFNNCFSTNDIKDQLSHNNETRSRVIYSNISMLNHRCEFNCDYLNVGDSIVIYCVDDIPPGSELFISYKVIPEYERRLFILDTWGINCNCILCHEQQAVQYGQTLDRYRSRQLKKFQLMDRYMDKQLMEFYDYDAFKFMLFDLKESKKAAVMLRRILSMSEKECQDLIAVNDQQ